MLNNLDDNPTSHDILVDIWEKVHTLYEWAQAVDGGIRDAQNSGGMMGMLAKSMIPTNLPGLPMMGIPNGNSHR